MLQNKSQNNTLLQKSNVGYVYCYSVLLNIGKTLIAFMCNFGTYALNIDENLKKDSREYFRSFNRSLVTSSS